MIIEELTLSGWRSYRETRTFAFGEKVSLLVGPNEAGKSTILEALQRALFDRHNGSSKEIKALQPAGTSLTPEVTVTFRSNGVRYRIQKRFLRDPQAVLFEESGATFRPVADGDAADERTLSMAGGSFPGSGASKPFHRGLAEALWYLQRELPVPEKDWNEGVLRGLSGVIQFAVESPIEKAVIARVEREHELAFTPTGREKKGQARGELSVTRDRLSQLGETLEPLRSKLGSVKVAREALERLQVEREDKDRELSERRNELNAERKTLESSGEVGQARARSEEGFRRATEELQHLQGVLKDLDNKVGRIKSLTEQIQELTNKLGIGNAELQAEQGSVARCRDEKAQVKLPALHTVEAELDQLQALEHRRTLKKTLERLRRHLDRLESAKREQDEKNKSLDSLRAPTKPEWEAFKKLQTKIQVKEGEARAASIRVSIRLQKKGLKVSSEPVAHQDGDEYLVVKPTTFDLDGLARIHVRALGESLERLNEELKQMREESQVTLTRFGVAGEEALAASFAQRESLEREVKDIRRRFKDLNEEEPDAEREFTRCRRGLEEEEAKTPKLPQETLEWGGEKIRATITDLKRRKKDILAEIVELEAEETRATNRVQTLLQESANAREGLSELTARKNQYGKEVEDTFSKHGSRLHLEGEISKATEEWETRRKEVERLSREYEEKVDAPQKRAKSAEKAVNTLSDRIRDIDVEKAGHERDIERYTSEGVYTKEGDLEAEIAVLKARVSVLERRAEAIKLLRSVLEECQEVRTHALTQPLREVMVPWFRELTGGAYDGVEIGPNIVPTEATLRNGQRIPAGWLSYGTSEQVVVLVRLAMGILAGKVDRQTVVLDDRLVNADPVRARRLASIVEQAGEKCQVLMTTCNDAAYSGMEVQVIRVPGDRQAASESL